MGTTGSRAIDLDSSHYFRRLNRIERGTKVLLTLYSKSGDGEPEKRIGIVTDTDTTAETGCPVITFKDVDNETTLKITVGETIRDTLITQKDSDFWFPVGHLLRLRVFTDCATKTQLLFDAISEHETQRYETVAIAARIALNREMIAWLEWSDNAA